MKKKLIPCAILLSAIIFVCMKKMPEPDFSAELLKVATEYKSYTASDKIRIAPMMCAPVNYTDPGNKTLFISNSSDTITHGKKVYYLFVKNETGYVDSKEQSEGQVIVKESHFAIEEKAEKKKKTRSKVSNGNPGNSTEKFAYADNKKYSAGDVFSLFIMMKKKKGTEGTDDGWVYATTDATGKKITGSGKITSCMNCHKESKKDRMLGN